MDDRPTRLDVLVTAQKANLTRSQASKLITAGLVSVDSRVITKPASKFLKSNKIKINVSENSKTPVDIPIVYEDNDVVVINKPAGLLSHSKGSFNEETTVADWLDQHLNRHTSTNREGIVHRLDRATSGLMILAKNEEAQKWLVKQFSTRKVSKTYIAVVGGTLNQEEALIDMPIERNPKKPQKFRVGAPGKPAQTSYKVLKEANDKSLIELKPKTGRTHQLRVHLAALSHPIIGDALYDGLPADRLYLHSVQLELTLPDKSRRIFKASLPAQFKAMVK